MLAFPDPQSCPDGMVSLDLARRHARVAFCMLACVTLCAVPGKAQSMRYEWWLAPGVRAQLHLSPEQVNQIDDLFESTLGARRAQRQQLDTLESQLDTLLDHATADDQQAAALIARVEAARARRNVARMMMLYRMRRLLTPDQRQWFDSHPIQSNRGSVMPRIH